MRPIRRLLAETLARHAPGLSRVVLETGTLSAFLYHGLIERGVRRSALRAPCQEGALDRVNKSDPHDAEGLAQLARTGWFKAVHIKESATHMDRAQLKVREQLIKVASGDAGPASRPLEAVRPAAGQGDHAWQARRAARGAVRAEAGAAGSAPLIEGLAALEEQIARLAQAAAARAAADPVAVRLMSVPGVGPITALCFKSSIEDPSRFARGEDAGAYAGLVPRRIQSGERDTKGRISKAGDPMLRSALYEAANNLLARVKRPCALQTWGKALAEHQGRQARPCRRRPQARHPAPQALADGDRASDGPERPRRPDRRPRRAISLIL